MSQFPSLPFTSSSIRGGRVYHGTLLKLYDFLVGIVSCSLIWNCPRSIQHELYRKHLSSNHLEIGAASVWFLTHTPPTDPTPRYTLCDISSAALDNAQHQLASFHPDRIHTDILSSIPIAAPYTSVGLNFVLHCLPGTMEDKSAAIKNIAQALTDDGVLFGSTLIGQPQRSWLPARVLNKIYNRYGIFSNTHDSYDQLQTLLDTYFHEVTLRQHGSAVLFTARTPRRDSP